MELREHIEQAWDNRELLKTPATQQVIREVINQLDKGLLRVAVPTGDSWVVNEWIKNKRARKNMCFIVTKTMATNHKKKAVRLGRTAFS